MQEILVQWFGETGASAARYVFALAVVVVLLLILRWAMQRYMNGAGLRVGRGRQQRLAVMDAAVVDARRRLVLVRRDNVEHLLLIGGPTDVVVEQTIIRRMPVGTAGWMPQRQSEAPATETVTTPPEPAPIPGQAQVKPEAPAVDVRRTPEARTADPRPVAMPRIVEVPRAPEPPRASEVQRRVEAPATREPAPAPYVPPAPVMPEPPAAPAIAEVVVPEPAPSPQVPAPAEDFDDLARRLDEALRIDIEEARDSAPPKPAPSFGRPSRGPAARMTELAEITPVPPVEPVLSAPVEPPPPAPEPEVLPEIRPEIVAVEPPPPVVVTAPEPAPAPKPAPTVMSNTWFRPRTPKAPEPAKSAPQITPVSRPPVAPAPVVEVPSEPMSEAELSAALADDLAKLMMAEPAPLAPAPEPRIEPVIATPEPAPAPAPKKTSEFSSLEDEMARLLDELSGDKSGR